MRRKKEDFEAYTIQELFDEIISLEQGDMWDGMSSKANSYNCDLAKKVFGEKMIKQGIEWK